MIMNNRPPQIPVEARNNAYYGVTEVMVLTGPKARDTTLLEKLIYSRHEVSLGVSIHYLDCDQKNSDGNRICRYNKSRQSFLSSWYRGTPTASRWVRPKSANPSLQELLGHQRSSVSSGSPMIICPEACQATPTHYLVEPRSRHSGRLRFRPLFPNFPCGSGSGKWTTTAGSEISPFAEHESPDQ